MPATADALETKTCSGCHCVLPLSAFAMKSPANGTRQSRCKDCARASSRAHYEANRAAVIAKSAQSKAALKLALRNEVESALQGKICCQCNSAGPLTFKLNSDFDGPRVSAAVGAGMALDTVRRSMANSKVICKPCDFKDSGKAIQAYNKAKHAGVEFVGSGLSRAEQKKLKTHSTHDLRKNRFQEGRAGASI